MAKSRTTRSSLGSSVGASTGGILGSGIFGHIGTGVVCDAENTGMYCSLVKFVNVILMILMLIGIVYVVYVFLSGQNVLSGGGLKHVLRKSRI